MRPVGIIKIEDLGLSENVGRAAARRMIGAGSDPDRFDYAGRRLAETMGLAGVGVALIVFLGAQFGVDLVAGPHFNPSVRVLQILAFALLGTCVIAARGYALLSLGRLRAMMISNAIALSVVFGAGIPLISAHGATGGAIALTAAELTLALSYEVSLTRGRPQLRPSLGFVARVACAAGLAVLPRSCSTSRRWPRP